MATEQEIMDELLASYGGNEMRAYTPGPFEKQEQAIESFLSGIGQFAGEKEIPFLKALADPAYARNVASNLSFGTEMTPGVGDVQAIREGAFMMGEDQPLMGSAFIAGSLFTGMSSAQLKKALKKAEQKLEKARTMEYHGQSHMKETNAPKDRRFGEKLYDRSQTDIAKHKTEIAEINEALKQGELPLSENLLAKEIDPDNPYIRIIPANEKGKNITLDLTPGHRRSDFEHQMEDIKEGLLTNRSYDQLIRDEVTAAYFPKAAAKTPEPKGIINATPEIRKLYDDLQRGWLKDLTPEHRQLSKEMSEQTAEFNKFLDEAELDERNQFFQMMLDMKNKKPK
tara:strand:+ start:2893 stop:3912 length:1020 start_codon:yes stop_codon:yes gene_type:complete